MASDDTPGFLSKVARFVRNPLTNWSDLDQAETDQKKGYNKAALKQMIERKRRNDFVRRREFDQLRKLRSRGGKPEAEVVDRPSFFQTSSLPSTSTERAGTLRKINEIEAQMSQQWWTGRGNAEGAPPQPAALRPTPDAASPPTSEDGMAGSDAPMPQPESAATVVPSQPVTYAPTEPLPVDRAPDAEPWSQSLHWPTDADDRPVPDEPASDPAESFVHDPDLEEAAIRFANGDYEGAEAVLLAQIAPGAAGIERDQVWLTLFDLYRATGQHDRFDSIAVDFASRFGRSAPVWFAMSDAPPQPSAGGTPMRPAVLPVVRGFNWTASGELHAKTLVALDAALATAPKPWRLNWSRLDSIDDAALDLLLQMVRRWCAQPVELRFVGSARLMQLLADSTPVGDAKADPLRWRLRMELLRLMGRPDEFDSVALDYCITYEISPPSWTAARCTYREVDSDGVVAATAQVESATTYDSGLNSMPAALQTVPGLLDFQDQPLELAGQLVGDADEALARLEQDAAGRQTLAIRCDRLARVDFSAAGSVLNWVAARHAQGCRIEFGNVQRLVAVFFNVIGINEYARIMARQN